MKKNKIVEQVPVDYYQKGIKTNILQRIWHYGKLKAIISEIDYHPAKVLDVGCASGWFINEVKKNIPKSKYYGIDIYSDAISYAIKKYPNISFTVGNAEKIPFKNDTFDLIICTEVLEHVENPDRVINEMKRVVKKNGKIIVELDSGSLLFSIIWYVWRKFYGKVWNDSHLHSFNVNKLESKLKNNKLKVLKKYKINFNMAMVFVSSKK